MHLKGSEIVPVSADSYEIAFIQFSICVDAKFRIIFIISDVSLLRKKLNNLMIQVCFGAPCYMNDAVVFMWV